ncbi:hypothetical protein [Prosthecobacter sp.]|uniref:hypothetical protein n=1 Tax=Prosthecobacter sp. TaxID=1965333 RepID=UPI0037830393
MSTARFTTLFIFALGLLSACNAQSTAGTAAPEALAAGRFQVSISPQWRVAEGEEEAALKAEVKKGMDQMIERYRKDSGGDLRTLGIQDFAAAQLAARSGWFIVHEIKIPPQQNYYEDMQAENRKKIEWGIQQGMFLRASENGLVTLGGHKFIKTVMQNRGGGRTITLAYWTPQQPALVTQILVVQNNDNAEVSAQVDAAIATVTVK